MSDEERSAREELRELKYSYFAAVDRALSERSDAAIAEAVALCTEDIRVDVGPYGVFEGHEGIAQLCEAARNVFFASLHIATNPIIKVDGDRAEARWVMLVYTVAAEGEPSKQEISCHQDTYVKVGDHWRIAGTVETRPI